jgi:hypothetical protein
MHEIRSNLLVRRLNLILTIRSIQFATHHAKKSYILRGQAMKKYKEVSLWWYSILLSLSFIAGQYHHFSDSAHF